MGFFDIGNLIVLLISAIMIFVSRRLDGQNRSLDSVRRFLENAKKEFDDDTKLRQERLLVLGESLNSFERNSKELLKRFQSDYQTAVNESANLEEVKTLIVEMVRQKEDVFNVLENLKKDSIYVSKISKDLDLASEKMRAIEQSSERLLAELTSRNQKSLESYKDLFLNKIDDESIAIKNNLEEQIKEAESLRRELDDILNKKETALVASLKVYNAEFENMQNAYIERFKQIEEVNVNRAKAFEDNLKRLEQTSYTKIEEAFKQEIETIRNQAVNLLDKEFNDRKEEHESFINQYSTKQDELAGKFDFLDGNFNKMQEKQQEFEHLMKNLGDFMDEEFLKESNRIQTMMSQKVQSIEDNLLELNNNRFKNLEENFKVQLDQVSVIGDTALEQINLISDSYKLKEDMLNENIKELADDLLHLKESSLASFRAQEDFYKQKWLSMEDLSNETKENIDASLENHARGVEIDLEEKITAKARELESLLLAKVDEVERYNLAKIEDLKVEKFYSDRLDKEYIVMLDDLSENLRKELVLTKDNIEDKINSYYDEAKRNLTNEFDGKLNQITTYIENKVSLTEDDIANLENIYKDKINATEQNIAILENTYKEKINATEQNIAMLENTYKDKISITEQNIITLENTYKDKIASAETDIDSLRANYEEKFVIAQNDIANLEIVYKDKIAESLEQWKGWSDRSSALEEQFNTLNTRAINQEQEADRFFNSLKNDASEKIERLQKDIVDKFDNKHSVAFEDVKLKINELDNIKEQLEHQVKLMQDTIADRADHIKANMETSLKGVWDNVNLLRDSYEAKYKEFFTKFEMEQQSAVSDINNTQEQILRRISEFDNSIETKLANLEITKEDIFNKTEADFNKINLDIEAKIDASKLKVEDLNRSWQDRIDDVQSIYSSKLMESTSLFDKYKEEINGKFSTLNEEFDAKITLINSGIEDKIEQVYVRAELIEGAWSERYDSYTNESSARLSQSELLIEEQLNAWRDKTDAVESSLNARLREAGDLALVWEDKLGEAKAQMDAHWNSLSFDKKVLDDKWNEKIEVLRKYAQDELMVFEKEHLEIEKNWKEKMASLVGDINGWSEELETLTAEKMQSLEKKWQSAFDGFSGKDDERLKVVSDHAQKVEEFWQEKLGEFNVEIENRMQSLENEFSNHVAAVETAWQSKLKEVNKILEDKDNYFEKELKEVDAKASDLRFHFESLTDNLNTDLEKSKTLVHDELAKQLENLSLKVKAEWETRLDDLKINVLQRIEQSQTMMSVLNESSKALEDDKENFKNQIETLSNEIVSVYESGKAKIDESFKGFDDGLATWQINYNSDINSIKDNFDERLEALSNSKNEIVLSEQKIQSQLESLEKTSIDFNDKFKDLYEKYSIDYIKQKELDEVKIESYVANLDKNWQEMEHKLQDSFEQNLNKMKVLMSVHEEQIAIAKAKVDSTVDRNIEDISKAWQEKLDDFVKNQQKVESSIVDKFAEIDSKVSNLKTEAEAKIKTNFDALNLQNSDLERSYLDKHKEFSGNLQKEMDDLKDKVSDLAGIYFSKQQELELLFDDRMTEINDSWQIFNSRLEDKQKLLDSDFAVKVEVVQTRLSNLENDLKHKQDNFESTFSDRLTISIENLKEMQSKFDAQRADFDIALQQQVAKAEASMKALELDFSGRQNNFELEFQNRLTDASKEVDVLLATYKDRYLEFDNEFKANFDDTMLKVNDLERIVADKNQEFSLKAEDSFLKLENNFNVQASLLENKTSEIEAKFLSLKEKAETIFAKSEQSVSIKSEQIDAMLKQNEEQTSELANLMEQNKSAFFSGMEDFNKQIDLSFNKRKDELDSLIEAHNSSNVDKIEEIFSNELANLKNRLDLSSELLGSHEKEIASKIENYRLSFNNDFDSLANFRDNMANEMKNQEETLKILINSTIKQTAEELTLELLNSVEARLTEYEEVVKTKTGRIELFMSDVDNVETNLRGSFEDIQKAILENINQFEDDIKKRYDSELEYIMQNMALSKQELEDKISTVSHIINNVKDEAELLKDKFTGTMNEYLGEFEDQLKEEKDKLQDVLKDKINEIEQKVIADEEAKKDLFLQNLKSFETELQKEQHSLQNRLQENLAFIEKERAKLDEKIKENSMHYNKQQDTINQQMRSNITILEEKMDSDGALIKEKLSQFDKLEADYKEKIANMQSKIDMSLEKLLQGQLDIDNTITKTLDSFSEKFALEQKNFDDIIKNQGKDLEDRLEVIVNDKISHTEQSINKEFDKFNDKVQTLVYSLQNQGQEIASELDSLKSSVDTKVEQFASLAGEEVEARFNEIQTVLKQRLADIELFTDTLSGEIKEKLTKDKVYLDNAIDNYKTDFDKLKLSNAQQISTNHSEINNKIALLDETLSSKIEFINNYYETTKRDSENFIQSLRDQFNDKVEQFARIVEQEKNKYNLTLDNLGVKVIEIEEKVQKQATSNIDKITKISNELTTEFTRKSKQSNQEIDDKTIYLRTEIVAMKEQVDLLKTKLETSIDDEANRLANRLSEIESRQRDFESASPVFEEINKMRSELEKAINILNNDMQQVSKNRAELKEVETKMQEAFNLNEALTAKLALLESARNQINELDSKTESVIKLSDAVEHKIAKISAFANDLEEIKNSLQTLGSYEKDLSTKLNEIETQAGNLRHLDNAINNSEGRMASLETQINKAIEIYASMGDDLSHAQASLEELSSQEPKIDHLIKFFTTIDEKVADMESKVTHIDNMRDWIVTAEQRLIDINEEAKHNMRTIASTATAINDGSAAPRKRQSASGDFKDEVSTVSSSDMILKLQEQGWTAEQIASKLKLSITQVRLVLERNSRGK